MTDMYLQPEVHVVITQIPGVDSAGTVAQLAQIESGIAELQSRTVITSFDDVPGVNAAGAANGQTIVYDSTSDEWNPADLGLPLTGQPGGSGTRFGPITTILTSAKGINIVQFPDEEGVAEIVPVVGTASNTLAVGDHTHIVRPNSGRDFGATGTLSSGTRVLITSTITGLDPARSYVLTGDLRFDVRGEGTGAGQHRPSIKISATTQDRNIPVRTVSGVDRLSESTFDGITIFGVSSVAISASASYVDGDPVYVGGGKLTVSVKSNR